MSRVSVATYPTRAEAQTVAQMLSEAGLDAVVVGDDAGGALPHLTVGLGGSTVSVLSGQEPAAAELLDVAPDDHREPEPADPVLDRRAQRRRQLLQLTAAAALVLLVVMVAFSTISS